MAHLTDFFPKEYTPRPQQIHALNKIEAIWASGKKIAIGCLPTGSGKSHIARAIAESAREIPPHLRDYVENYDIYTKSKKSDNAASDFMSAESFGAFILTVTKSLQDQYKMLFPEGVSVQGKTNYPCDIDNRCDANFAPCTLSPQLKISCFKANRCAYYKTRNDGLISKIPFLNYSAFLNLCPSYLQRREILILDEAAELEDEIVSKYSLSLSYKGLRIEGIDHSPLKGTAPNDVMNYLTNLHIAVKESYESALKSSKAKVDDRGFGSMKKEGAKITRLQRLLSNIEEVVENWESCSYMVEKQDHESVSFVPYDIRPLTRKIFNSADKILMMSATLSNVKEYAKSIGIKEDEYEYFEVDSEFDASKSPIKVARKYCLSWKTMDEMLPKVVDMAMQICDMHPNEKGVIHTHTHKIAEELKKCLGNDDRFLFREKGVTNQDILETHFKTKRPTVLISPSLDTGVSLDDELGRFQIIMKAPYLPLGSNRVKRMFDENPEHYFMKMLDTIIQMCGRCTRSKFDHSTTYILDGTAVNAILRDKANLPKHFLDRFI